MLDERTKMMLEVANTLTAEDLEYLRGGTEVAQPESEPVHAECEKSRMNKPRASESSNVAASGPNLAMSRGERERQRTRESKISTACVGAERAKHEWWPLGTELIGSIGVGQFTACVVENPRVKSGRSILITSGSAQGSVCITPTRAAIEATESYRQANTLGRGGGVTNGWTFWKPRN